MIAAMKRKSHTKEKFHGLTKQLKKIAILGCETEQKARTIFVVIVQKIIFHHKY